MGCGQKSWNDDEEDWDRLQREADILDVPWKTNSRHAGFAEKIYRETKAKGLVLKLMVLQKVELEDMLIRHDKDVKELKAAIKLLEKLS